MFYYHGKWRPRRQNVGGAPPKEAVVAIRREIRITIGAWLGLKLQRESNTIAQVRLLGTTAKQKTCKVLAAVSCERSSPGGALGVAMWVDTPNPTRYTMCSEQKRGVRKAWAHPSIVKISLKYKVLNR